MILDEKQCPDRERYHTIMPEPYLAWREAADRRASRGEVQEQCPTCKLWAVWRVKEDDRKVVSDVREAMRNGADEDLWPSGKTLPEAVRLLVDRVKAKP